MQHKPTPYEQEQAKQKQEREQHGEQPRIYLVTDVLKAQSTREAYTIGFNQFIKITIKNDNLRALLDTKQGVIESKIISHIEYLRDVKKLKYWSIQVYCAAILHFFEMNDVVLNTKKIKRFLPADEGHYNQDRPYSITEIQQILDKCDIRSRVIVLLMVSTGMRVGAIPGLRLSDIKKMDEFGLYLIWVYNNSEKERYFTFTTPECARAIDNYLYAYRKRLGEELKDSSPLIRNKISPDNIFTIKAPKFISNKAIQVIVDDLLKQSGLLKSKQEVMRTHGFRKWHANQCSRTHIDYPTREYLIGHKLPGQEPSYNRMTEEDRLNEFVKAIPLLTIDPSANLKDRVKELETERNQEITLLKSKYAMLEQEYQQFSHLRAAINLRVKIHAQEMMLHECRTARTTRTASYIPLFLMKYWTISTSIRSRLLTSILLQAFLYAMRTLAESGRTVMGLVHWLGQMETLAINLQLPSMSERNVYDYTKSILRVVNRRNTGRMS